MKAGDKVYKARLRYDGLEVVEATLLTAGEKQVTLDSGNHAPWRFRRKVSPSECHLTREAAIREVLEQERTSARDFRESMEAAEQNVKMLEEMLAKT